MTPLELRDLQALAFIRRGRVQQVVRVPPVGERSRPWYLALDGTFADESIDPAAAVLSVGNMATHWKQAAAVSAPAQPNAATRRDLDALQRLRAGEVQQLIWMAERKLFLALGTHGTGEDADPADAMIKAALARPQPRLSRRR